MSIAAPGDTNPSDATELMHTTFVLGNFSLLHFALTQFYNQHYDYVGIVLIR